MEYVGKVVPSLPPEANSQCPRGQGNAIHLSNVLVIFRGALIHQGTIRVSGTPLAKIVTNDGACSSLSARMMPVDDGRQPFGISVFIKQVCNILNGITGGSGNFIDDGMEYSSITSSHCVIVGSIGYPSGDSCIMKPIQSNDESLKIDA